MIPIKLNNNGENMVVPKFEDFYLPTLKFFEDNEVHTKKEACEYNKNFFNLSEDELMETTSEGNKFRYKDRTEWAVTHLHKAGLLNRESRGNYIISNSGLELLDSNPDEIDRNVLMGYESFVNFRNRSDNQEEETEITFETFESLSPTERLGDAYSEINDYLSSTLLEEVLNNSSDFFEKLVVDLLINMGYGGSKKEAGKVIGKVGDDGVDGVIKEDPLGLSHIYLQAKRYAKGNNVGAPEVRSFIGALVQKRSSKGVFITTSDFTASAKNAIKEADKHIALINGEELTKLMIEYDVGVFTKETYEIKDIDTDYFDS